MLQHLTGILRETWSLYLNMAPYLVLGLIVAGVLYVVLPAAKVMKHLSGRNFLSTLKATLFGIPLPLCSCSVIPVATHLRREGASRSATLAFMISTPSTGVDSILATYSLMGWLFTVARTLADFLTALVAGIVMNLVDGKGSRASAGVVNQPVNTCHDGKSCCRGPAENEKSSMPVNPAAPSRLSRIIHYAFVTLVRDIGWWLLAGIVLGGLISYLVPAELVHEYLGNPLLAYPVMFLIGLPLYVCATGSIPIVAPLLMKGLAPGAALVFLIVGPATNTATITIVGRLLGKKALIVYLASITLCAFLFGLVLDAIWIWAGGELTLQAVQDGVLPHWLKIAAAIVLLISFAVAMRPHRRGTADATKGAEDADVAPLRS